MSLFGWFCLIVVIKLRVLFVFDEDWSSTQWFIKESHYFDKYLGSRYCLVCFDPVSVDYRDEITCFCCVFVNAIIEMSFRWDDDGPALKRILRLSRFGGLKCILWYFFFILLQRKFVFPFFYTTLEIAVEFCVRPPWGGILAKPV